MNHYSTKRAKKHSGYQVREALPGKAAVLMQFRGYGRTLGAGWTGPHPTGPLDVELELKGFNWLDGL